MHAPWIKFYPSDWRSDPALRMCSIGARGLWMELLCLMHEAEPYGSLLVNGRQLTDRQLSSLAGVSLDELTGLLAELEEAGVFSREADGTIYSRRMRRDDEKAETDRANGRRGGNPRLNGSLNPPSNPPVNPPLKVRVNGEDKAQNPESRYQSPESRNQSPESEPESRVQKEREEERKKETRARVALRASVVPPSDWPLDAFEQFWRLYPHKIGRKKVEAKFALVQRNGTVSFDALMEGLQRYVGKNDDRPWCNPETWLNQGRWDDEPARFGGKPKDRRDFMGALDFLEERVAFFSNGRG